MHLLSFISSFWREFAEPISRRDAAIHEKVAARDKRAVWPHEEGANGSDLVRGSGSARRAQFHHAPVARAARPFLEIYLQDGFGRRLGRGNPGGVDDPRNFAQGGGLLVERLD